MASPRAQGVQMTPLVLSLGSPNGRLDPDSDAEDKDFEQSPLLTSRRSAGGSRGSKDAGEGGAAIATLQGLQQEELRRGSMSKWRKGETKARGWGEYLRRTLGELVLGSWLNVLLVFGPVAVVAVHVLHMAPGWVFGFSLLALMPLAERLGWVTEQLALYTGPTLGGLLNATFGNATELIISILALRSSPPLVRVVQMSLLGSILSNMLLVLGASFFAGGLLFREQKFNTAGAMVNSGLLLMAVMGLTFPAVLQATHTELNGENSELLLSRFSSCCMLLAYACYLYFQLKTHPHLYDEDKDDDDDEEEEEEAILGLWGSVFWLAVIAVLISILSEYLVDAIDGAAASWGLPLPFISVVILPIVGNAAEHASSVMFAMKNKIDISLGIAIGSSTQISMFAIPFCVVYGWVIGVPMDLDFKLFETATLCLTVLVVSALLQKGECNYFMGIMLLLSYLIVAASFYVHSDNDVPDVASASALNISLTPAMPASGPAASTP